MLKAVLSIALPIIAAAAFFGRNAATISSNVAPDRPAATSEAHPATSGARRPTAFEARSCRRGEELVVTADRSGHFQVSMEIGGREVPMMVDTGATRVVLPHQEAVRLGLRLDDGQKALVSTANGVASAVVTRADRLRFGPICLTNVEVLVMPPGRLAIGLLGMNAIGQLARFEMSRTRLVMAH